MYGHMDKQPPLTEGWEEGLGKEPSSFAITICQWAAHVWHVFLVKGPYTPVIRDGKVFFPLSGFCVCIVLTLSDQFSSFSFMEEVAVMVSFALIMAPSVMLLPQFAALRN